jgi:glucose/arabinose dehydrogenase
MDDNMRRFPVLLPALVLVGGLFSPLVSSSQAAAPPQFADELVASLRSPTAIAFMPDGRMLATTQAGQLRVLAGGVLRPTPALDLNTRMCTNSERGLLGVATDPDPGSRAIFLFYTPRGSSTACPTNAASGANPSGAPRHRVSRFVLRDDSTVDPASETILLDGIYSPAGYHNAGDLHVGKDNNLYVSTGDGGCDYRGRAGSPGGSGCGGTNDASRDRNILNGKILRITRTGGIPADNPFQGTGTASCRTAPAAAGTTCQEIFALGLRNPFRMAFDPNASGTSFRINDVGQDVWEEINRGVKGADYGWNAREGLCARTGSATDCGPAKPAQYTDPSYVYGHSGGCSSITGGAFVPNGAWPAAYTGAYLFSDYVCGKIFSLANGARSDFATELGAGSAVHLEFGPYANTQALYYTSYANGGQIRRISYTGTANRVPTAVLTANPTSGAAPLAVTLNGAASRDPDGDALTYLWSYGDGTAAETSSASTRTHNYRSGNWTATLRVRDAANNVSAPVTVAISSGNHAPAVSISSPSAGQLFTAGTTYVLRGSASDAEDGALPGSALSWRILRRHNTHTHPFLGPVTGNNIAMVAPGPENLAAAADSDLRIELTATDSKGVKTTVTRVFAPRKINVTFATSPAGRVVTVDGSRITGPTTLTSWAGYGLQVGVPEQVDAQGQRFGFGSWSDGGGAAHTFTPLQASTLTATLQARGPSAPAGVSAAPSGAGAATIKWGPPASTGGSPVTGYRVSRNGTDSAGQGPYTTTVAASARSFTMTRLVVGQRYTLSVQAITAAGTSAAVGRAVTVTTWNLPGAPTAATAAQSGPGAAVINWSPPTSTGGPPVTGYRVSRNGVDSAGQGAYTTTGAATARSFTMTRLVVGQRYTLSVRAITAVGTGPAVSRSVAIR